MEKAPHQHEKAHVDEHPFSNGIPDSVPEVTSLKSIEEGGDITSREKAKHLLAEIESTKGIFASGGQETSVSDKKEEHESVPNPSRRRFLRQALTYGAGATIVSIPFLGRLFNKGDVVSQKGKKEIDDVNRLARELDAVEKDDSIEQRERFIKRVRETGEFIVRNEDTILDMDVMEALKEYWQKQFMTRRDGREGIPFAWEDILLARERMRPYMPSMRRAFKNQGLSDALVGLAIVESWGDRFARSQAGAKGLYQFTESTGRMYGLETEADFFDPIKSSLAAAKYIATMYDTNGGSLPLALHEYNGGYALAYRMNHADKKADYAGFLKEIESTINAKKQKLGNIDEQTFLEEVKDGNGFLHGLFENIAYPAKVFAAEHAMRQVDKEELEKETLLARR